MMDDRSSNMVLLRRSPFFQAAGAEAMAGLLRQSFTQLLPRGSVLFEQHEQADFVHLLLGGRIGLLAVAEAGARTIVEIFGVGEVFLVPAVVLRLPYLASAIALTEVRVMMIPAEALRQAIAQHPTVARAAVELLSRHWRLMVDQVVELKAYNAETRVARFLARRAAEEFGSGTASLPEPRGAIAARLGMTPETLSRSLAALQQKDLVRHGKNDAVVAGRTVLAG